MDVGGPFRFAHVVLAGHDGLVPVETVRAREQDVIAPAILQLVGELPGEYKQLLKASSDVGSFVIGIVPGGAIVTLVTTFMSANQAHQSLKEVHRAFRGVDPEKVQSQLEQVHAETEMELHRAKVVEHAEKEEERLLHHIQISFETLGQQEIELKGLDEGEWAELLKLSKEAFPDRNRAGIELSPMMTLLHFEIGKLSQALDALSEFSNSSLTDKLKQAYAQIINLRRLVSERAKLLREQNAAGLALVKREEQELYDLSATTQFFQAQIKVLFQHRAALEALLTDIIRYDSEGKSLLRVMLPPYFEKVREFRDRHTILEAKFQRSLEAIREQYLEPMARAEPVAA